MWSELKHYWQIISHPRSWWTHTRFWWYTSHQERIVIGSILFVVCSVVGVLAYQKVNYALKEQELYCLAMNIYHEARGEPLSGQYAVGEVTMNRVFSEEYPDTICEVVHQKHYNPKSKTWSTAFSWTEYDYSVNLRSKPWKQAYHIAREVYEDDYERRLDGALFYHAKYVKPGWAKRYEKVATIGKHIFYKEKKI
jgi:spore germination cell wall hydrolase CwlJ-like protein